MAKISVVFSFYNEADVFDELFDRMGRVFRESLSSYDYELVFVNDASTDASLSILRARAAVDPRVKIVNMSRNFGVSQCTMAGMSYATGDAVVMMDTDLQDPPEVIPDLVKRWEEGADVAYTVRTRRDGEPALKMFVTAIGYRVLKGMSDIDMPIQSGDFKLLSRRVVDAVLSLQEKEPFLRGLVRWVGFKQEPVYYNRDPRAGGETHFLFYQSRVLRNFLSGITAFSDLPLIWVFILGIVVSSGAFLYLIAIFVMKYLNWNLPGWSAIMATMLVLGGSQILATGVVGLYVAKIHAEVKRRPNYIVSDTVGFESRRP